MLSLFADSMILHIKEPPTHQNKKLKRKFLEIIKKFNSMSGYRINLHKSHLFYTWTSNILQEVEDKPLLLKIPHISDTGPRVLRAGTDLKASGFWGLAFMAPEGSKKASKGGKQPRLLLSYCTYEPITKTSMAQYPNGAVVSATCTLAVTTAL